MSRPYISSQFPVRNIRLVSHFSRKKQKAWFGVQSTGLNFGSKLPWFSVFFSCKKERNVIVKKFGAHGGSWALPLGCDQKKYRNSQAVRSGGYTMDGDVNENTCKKKTFLSKRNASEKMFSFLSGFVDPFSIAGVFTGHQWFLDRIVLCHVIGSVCLVSCVCSLWSIAAISVNRYILLCRQQFYKHIFTWRNSIFICIFLWFGAFLLDLPNFLNWGDHTYDMKTMACSYDRLASYSYTVFFIMMFVTMPLFTVLFCNVNIYITVIKSKMRVSSHLSGSQNSTPADASTMVYAIVDDEQTAGNSTIITENWSNTGGSTKEALAVPETEAAKTARKIKQKKAKGREMRNDIRLARTLFIVFIAFCFCWTPYALICLIDKHDNIHKAWYAFSILLAHASSTLNSILYAVTNRTFRDGYKKFFKRIIRCLPKNKWRLSQPIVTRNRINS